MVKAIALVTNPTIGIATLIVQSYVFGHTLQVINLGGTKCAKALAKYKIQFTEWKGGKRPTNNIERIEAAMKRAEPDTEFITVQFDGNNHSVSELEAVRKAARKGFQSFFVPIEPEEISTYLECLEKDNA